MRNVRRFFTHNQTYFLTHVTYDRKPILIENVNLLWNAINKYKQQNPFDLIAWVILPDHWHIVLNPQQNDLSKLMKCIKLSFAQQFLKSQGQQSGRTWQNRFWDHMIRDEEDMNCHIDYIHYNPVKHGHVKSPTEYEHSSFNKFIDDGMYQQDWGFNQHISLEGEYGE